MRLWIIIFVMPKSNCLSGGVREVYQLRGEASKQPNETNWKNVKTIRVEVWQEVVRVKSCPCIEREMIYKIEIQTEESILD